MQYRNPTGPLIRFSTTTFESTLTQGVTCGSKTLTALIADNQTFKIATQAAPVVPAGMKSVSMTGRYPDFIKCE